MHWSHPSFGPLQPGAAAHERVEPPATTVTWHRVSRGWNFHSVVPVHNQWEPLFHLQGQRCSWVSLGPIGSIGSQLVIEFLQRTTPWMRITMNESRRKNHSTLGKVNVEAQAHATNNYISTIGTEWNSGFCWRNWRSQETAIGCGEGFKDLSAQDLTNM